MIVIVIVINKYTVGSVIETPLLPLQMPTMVSPVTFLWFSKFQVGYLSTPEHMHYTYQKQESGRLEIDTKKSRLVVKVSCCSTTTNVHFSFFLMPSFVLQIGELHSNTPIFVCNISFDDVLQMYSFSDWATCCRADPCQD